VIPLFVAEDDSKDSFPEDRPDEIVEKVSKRDIMYYCYGRSGG